MPGYFFSSSAPYVPGIASMWLLKFGLQKYLLRNQKTSTSSRTLRKAHAMLYRGG